MVRVKNILIIVNTAPGPPAKTAVLAGSLELWRNRVGDSEADFERLR